MLKLVDTFCTDLYSSSLLVHKPTLVSDLQAQRIKPHLVLSICALASSFYQNSDEASPFRANGFSREWAERAARLLFQEVEQPDEEKVVSFTNLCLFWYSHGDWQRAAVHEGNALIHLRLTGLSETVPGVAPGRVAEQTLSAEMRCRRFWAAYVINQFVSEPTASFSWGTISTMRLPCTEARFEVMSDASPPPPMALPWQTIRDDTRSESIFAEVVRITAFW